MAAKAGVYAPRYADGKKIALYAAIGRECRARRERAGIGLRSLADRIGVSHGTICKLEDGTTVPVALLVALAEEWDCTLDDLVPVTADAE